MIKYTKQFEEHGIYNLQPIISPQSYPKKLGTYTRVTYAAYLQLVGLPTKPCKPFEAETESFFFFFFGYDCNINIV
jgi:hypothetical protein